MKNLKVIALIGLGFMAIQSCSKQSEICDCIDLSAAISEGESTVHYNGTFRKKYLKEHQVENEKCEKLFSGVTDKAGQEKIVAELKQCKGYEAYTEGIQKQIEYTQQQ